MKTAKQALRSIPAVIRVGPFDVTVDIIGEFMERGHLGTYCGNTHHVSLAEDIRRPQQVVEVLLHELMHAVYDFACLHEADNEERVVSALTLGWMQVYRDNPWLNPWISKYVH